MNLSLFMTSDDLFNGFCKSRNIRDRTVKTYFARIKTSIGIEI